MQLLLKHKSKVKENKKCVSDTFLYIYFHYFIYNNKE